ncbi:MAG: hypothetical protein HY720_26915, partial [Planctomycetes bacterium]|nr:hypothetical protein [Planctomycetota bacterium]
MRSLHLHLVASVCLLGILAALPAPAQERQEVERPVRLSGAEERLADDLLARYIKSTDPGARKGIIEELAAIDHPSAADIRYFAPRCFARLVRRLAVCLGGFDLAAAEALGTAPPGVEPNPVDALELLVAHSLVQAHPEGKETRFTMLEAI